MIDTITRNILSKIIMLTISGSLSTILMMVLKPFLKNRLSRTSQYYIWLIVALQFILSISVSLNRPTYDHKIYTIKDVIEKQVFSENLSSETTIGNYSNTIIEEPRSHTGHLPFYNILITLWLIGVIITLFKNLYQYLSHIKLINKTLIYEETNPIPIFRSELTRTPIAVGLFAPRIILPQDHYPAKQRRYVLMHEMVHVKRFDIWIKWILLIIYAVHWYNPLIYLLRKEINIACELSCDEIIINKLNKKEKMDYGDTLLCVAGLNQVKDKQHIPITSLQVSKNNLRERLLAISTFKKKSGIFLAMVIINIIIVTNLFANVSLATDENDLPISASLSDIQISKILEFVATATKSEPSDIYIDANRQQMLNINEDYKWRGINTIDLFVESIDDCHYYIFRVEDTGVRISHVAKTALPPQKVSFEVLLYALKSLPINTIESSIPNTADAYILYFGGNREEGGIIEYYSGPAPNGATLNLELQPMNYKEGGGLQGKGSNAIYLTYHGDKEN